MPPRFATLAALVLGAALSAPAPADAQGMLVPGFWVFPPAAVTDTNALSRLCAQGMTLVQPDGGHLSFFVPPEADRPRLVVDAQSVCTPLAKGVTACTGQTFGPQGVGHTQALLSPGQGADGAPTLTHIDRATGRVTRSHPQECPDSAVRALLAGALAG